MGALTMLLRRWRADRGLLVLLAVVVAVTSGLAGAVPRLLQTLQAASLGAVLDETPTSQLGLAGSIIGPVVASVPERATDPDVARRSALAGALRSLDTRGDGIEEEIGPELRSVLGERSVVVESVRYDLVPLPGEPADALNRKLTTRYQQGVEPRLRVVEGVLPDGILDVHVQPTGEVGEDGEEIVEEYPLHQVAMTAATAQAMGLELGERKLAFPDTSGPINARSVISADEVIVVELSALVELDDIEDPFWFGDPRLHRPTQFDTNTSTTLFGHGLVTEDALTELPGASIGQLAQLTWRWRLDSGALLATDSAVVSDQALSLRTAATLRIEQPRWSTGLDRVIDAEAARRATALEVLGLGAVSVVVVAVALLVSVAGLLANRRREAIGLVRGRGASRPQLLLAGTVEAGLLAGAGALTALGVLRAALPSGSGGVGMVWSIAAAAVVVLVLGGWSDVVRPLGALLAERRRGGRPAASHAVLVGLLVLVAVVAVSALRQRGVDVDGEADLLVIAAPVLAAAAAAVVTARLSRVPLRAAELATRRQRALALPLGIARAARGTLATGVVTLVVLGLSVAGLAAAITSSLDAGQRRAAQERVGADVRADAPAFATLDPDWTPPGPDDVVADLTLLAGSLFTDIGAQRVRVLVIDPASIAALGNDDGTLPDLTWDGVAPAPVVVSSVLQPAGSPDVDDTLSVLVDLQRIAARIVAIDPRVLGLDEEDDGAFVVIDRAAVVAVTGTDPGSTSRLVRTTDPAGAAAAILRSDEDVEVTVKQDVLAALRDAPLARGVTVGFMVAAVAATVATLLALVLSLAASAPARRRDAAVLAAVGTPFSRVRAVVLAEVVPIVAIAALAGVVLTALVAALLEGRLDLAPFTGTIGASDVSLPPPLVSVALVVSAIAVTAIATVATLGRVDPAALLREGET